MSSEEKDSYERDTCDVLGVNILKTGGVKDELEDGLVKITEAIINERGGLS